MVVVVAEALMGARRIQPHHPSGKTNLYFVIGGASNPREVVGAAAVAVGGDDRHLIV